jgi:hypothetical protein
LVDRDYLLRIGETYHEALREKDLEMDQLTQELESTRGFLRGTQTGLQESESRSEDLLKEIRQRSTSSILVDTLIYPLIAWLEDVGGLEEEHQLMEDASTCVLRAVDLHVDVDPEVHPGSMMQHESEGDDMSTPEHTMMRDSSQSHAEMYGGIQRGIVPCREETHLGEYVDVTPLQQHIFVGDHLHHFSSCMGDERWRLDDQQLEGLLLVVLDGWDSVMTTGEHLSWIPMDEILVESLGLTKACDTSQSYSQLQMFLLACPEYFIIDSSRRRDRSWLRAWRMSRPSHTLHLGLVWSGPVGTFPMGRDLSSLLIIMTGHGDVWTGTSSTEVSLLIQFLDNGSNGHRYFS